MIDRKEKVIKGLQFCNQGERCRECPYAKTSYDPEQCVRGYLLFDALTLLKAQADEITFLKRMQQQLVAGMDASEVGAMAMKAMRGE